jgi:hypothetical protein
MFSSWQKRLLSSCLVLWAALVFSIIRWDGGNRLRSVHFPAGYSNASCSVSIIWGQQELLFCDHKRKGVLFAIDYHSATARVVIAREKSFQPLLIAGDTSMLLFEDNDALVMVDLVSNSHKRIPEPCSWPRAIALADNKAQVLCEAPGADADGSPRHRFSRCEISRDGIATAEINVGEFASSKESILVFGTTRVTPARFSAGRWWLLYRVRDQLLWDTLGGETVEVTSAVSGEYELPAAGQINDSALSLISADGSVTAMQPHRWSTGRLILRPSGLERLASENIDDVSERITMDGAAIILRYRKSSIESDTIYRRYEVSLADFPPAAIVLDIEVDKRHGRVANFGHGLAPIDDGVGGWYLTDGRGSYAHVTKAGSRLDPLSFREFPNSHNHTFWAITVYGWPVIFCSTLFIAWLRREKVEGFSKIPIAQVHGRLNLPRLRISSWFFATPFNTLVLAAGMCVFGWAVLLTFL